jgi:hypothetical protein
MMKNVFVINDSGHDFSEAEKFGKLIFLTEGHVQSFDTNKNFRSIIHKMKDVKEGDYILITSLASLNCIVGWIIGSLNLTLNILIYKNGKYLKRRIIPKLLYQMRKELKDDNRPQQRNS